MCVFCLSEVFFFFERDDPPKVRAAEYSPERGRPLKWELVLGVFHELFLPLGVYLAGRLTYPFLSLSLPLSPALSLSLFLLATMGWVFGVFFVFSPSLLSFTMDGQCLCDCSPHEDRFGSGGPLLLHPPLFITFLHPSLSLVDIVQGRSIGWVGGTSGSMDRGYSGWRGGERGRWGGSQSVEHVLPSSRWMAPGERTR